MNAPCCQIGDGAPAAVQQAFLTHFRATIEGDDALTDGAQRVGNGYVQTMTPVRILAAYYGGGSGWQSSGVCSQRRHPDGISRKRWTIGPAGYPCRTPTAGGRQNFVNASIAGNPAYMVSGQILTKWSALGYETGRLACAHRRASADLQPRSARPESSRLSKVDLSSESPAGPTTDKLIR